MQIILNGQNKEISAGLTVQKLVTELGLENTAIVAEHNENILQKEEWGKIILAENDRLELIKFCGGG